MTGYITIVYSNENSIFGSGELKFDKLSSDFIHGIQLAKRTYIGQSTPNIKSTNVKFDPECVIYQCPAHQYTALSSLDIFDQKSLQVLFTKTNVIMNKRYIIIIKHAKTKLTFAQFDSPDFVSGFFTFLSWLNDSGNNIVYNTFDQTRSYNIAVECLLPIVHRRLLVKQLINELLISDLNNIVWEYVVTKCESKVNDCTTEIDVLSKFDNGVNTRYEIYEDLPTGKGSAFEITTTRDQCIRCAKCRLDDDIKPFLCDVKLI